MSIASTTRIDGIDGAFLFGNKRQLDAHSSSAQKLSIMGSILVRSRPCLAELNEHDVLPGVVLFLYFILQNFITTLFKWGDA